ncbi:MAG TPA: LytTR family DNA-binding domain-containing protein [Bacteroidales bacterium]|nr:LytTR family DNA-binding domain-containing protein [Bacteroidales bacterium]HOK74112.1 LytTR family DNA-binding domain-containing protein [Bacteroidales bacterium]HOM40492.1 LytTR family DNA-binding domain-containing protein [Bacteroidales bacterium]HOU31051.1 LytTR family DNA-binding domain-containing protein [Bacteroidales bacterium]HPP92558.1 LytTR family DNA-binding domain-containing protein [Bacteroidales bacterium]
MRILIVEDETAAYENLLSVIKKIDPEIEIAGCAESVRQTIRWLRANPIPDLILMDIHLSDGSAFSIFDSINVESPVIFITAYDDYAIEAFKVNSIDYILKPIKEEDLRRALEKFKKLTHHDILKYLAQMTQMVSLPVYKDKLLIPEKDKLIPVDINEISCFYSTEKNTRVFLKNGKSYQWNRSLEQIEEGLNPADFIRANKQYIISRSSVKSITVWFDNRLLITLDTETPERIYVSKNRAAEFKAWMMHGKK